MTMNEQLNQLTTVPTSVLNRLTDREIDIISDYVHKSQLENKDTTIVDIGIGKLNILIQGEDLKIKFIPHKALRESLIKTVQSNISPLTDLVESTLKEKFTNIYKDLL